MTRRAFFHVGLPKTGTTAIQESFAAHRGELRSNGLLYPGSSVDHADLIPLFHQRGPKHFYYTQRGISEADALETSNRLLAEIDAEVTGFEGDVILSSEYFHNIGPVRLTWLKKFFEEKGYEFRVIVYLRHPVAATVSHANQDIKMGRRTLKELVEEPQWHSNQETLETLLRAMPAEHLIVRDFEAASGRNCVRDILEVCGYRGDVAAIDMPHANVSLTMTGAILADACHKIRAEDPPTPVNLTFALTAAGPKFGLPDSSLAIVREKSQEEVAWVRENFGIDLVEPKPSGEYADRLSPEATIALARYVASLQQQSVSLNAHISDLRQRVGNLEEENATLQQQLDALQPPQEPANEPVEHEQHTGGAQALG